MNTDMYTDMNSNIIADIRADLNTGKRHRPSFIRSALLILTAAAVLILPGCGGKKAPSVGIAEQYGIAYAPLQIMKEQKLLEKRLPGVEINWKQFGGPTGIREGMMNGEIDFGFMGVSPVLIGIDNGMKWRYATGISSNEVAIVTRNDIHSLTELTPKDRISILSPACTQHVLLCMLAGQQLGDPHALDNQLVSMSHPDSVNALLSATEITAHVSTPPYITQESDGGMHVMATGEEIVGQPFTFITGVAMEEFHDNRREYYDAVDYINSNMEEASQLLAPLYGISQEELYRQMGRDGTIYSSELNGVEIFNRQMAEMGFLSEELPADSLFFDNVVHH